MINIETGEKNFEPRLESNRVSSNSLDRTNVYLQLVTKNNTKVNVIEL